MAVGLVFVYAVLMSIWWITMKLLMRMRAGEEGQLSIPNNIIRLVSGFGASLLVIWSLINFGGMSYFISLPTEFWWALGGTIILNIAIAYCYVKAMQKSVASIAVHVTLFAPVVAIGTSWLFGVDRLPSILSVIGISSILFGLYLLHFNPRRYGFNLAGPFAEIWHERGNWLWYAVALALCAGCSIPLDKRCVQLSNYALAPGLTLLVAWGLFYSLAAIRAGDFTTLSYFPLGRTAVGLAVLALCFGVAQAFQAEAYNYQYAAAVASLKRLDAPFTVLWAFLLLRQEEQTEGHFGFRLLGSLTAFTGAVLIGIDKVVS